MSYDDWLTTEPTPELDPDDYCPDCGQLWHKCICKPDDSEEPEE